MTVDISQKDFGTLCICAIRYCQGRQSYMPSLVRKIVGGCIDKLSDNDIKVMLDDCKYQEQFDLYGDPRIDKPGWLLWKAKLEAEQERRKGLK